MSTQLTLRAVTKSYGDRLLFDTVSLSIRPGERVGVVGENGAGKSTLLRILAGQENPDDGEVIVVAESLGYLGQTPDLPPSSTVGDTIDAALAALRSLERDVRAGPASSDPVSLARYGDLLTTFEQRGGYEADVRVDKARHALGVAEFGVDRQLGTLSGGERARLGLACVLAARPEVLLLDEPTNHLDGDTLTWLEDQLRTHHGTVVAVSHDRVFLERVATAIVEVDGDRRALARYGNGYAGYLTEKAAARRHWEQAYQQWRAEITHLSTYATTTAHRVAPGRPMKDRNKPAYDRDRGRVQSSISTRVRNATERLRRLQNNPVPRPPDPLHFTVRLTGGTDGPVLTAHGINSAYFTQPAPSLAPTAPRSAPTNPLSAPSTPPTDPSLQPTSPPLQPTDPSPQPTNPPPTRLGGGPAASLAAGMVGVIKFGGSVDEWAGVRLVVDEFSVGVGDRVLICGPNGAGKTTLLRVLAGELVPDRGVVERRGRIGYLPQEVSVDRSGRSLLEAFADGRGGPAEEHAGRLLELGLFRREDLRVPVGALSVGQRRRLSLARLLSVDVDLLLLDEPTNHLSPVLVEELEEALGSFAGALVVVSHDRRLRRRFGGEVREMRRGKLGESGSLPS